MTPTRAHAAGVLAGAPIPLASLALPTVPLHTALLAGGIVAACAWTFVAYPVARRFHFRRVDGRAFWLSPVYLLVLGAAVLLAGTLPVPIATRGVLAVAVVGTALAGLALGALMVRHEGLIEHEWRG